MFTSVIIVTYYTFTSNPNPTTPKQELYN